MFYIYIKFLMYNFQVYLSKRAFFSPFFQVAKHVGNINSYLMSMAPKWSDHKIRRKNIWYHEKHLFAPKCRFFRISEISFLYYSMLKFMINNILKRCLHWQLHTLKYFQKICGHPSKCGIKTVKIEYRYLWKIARTFVKKWFFQLFCIDIESKHQSRSQFCFWVKNSIFTNFKMKILKTDFFRENCLLLNPFQETPSNFLLSWIVLSIKLTKNHI